MCQNAPHRSSSKEHAYLASSTQYRSPASHSFMMVVSKTQIFWPWDNRVSSAHHATILPQSVKDGVEVLHVARKGTTMQEKRCLDRSHPHRRQEKKIAVASSQRHRNRSSSPSMQEEGSSYHSRRSPSHHPHPPIPNASSLTPV